MVLRPSSANHSTGTHFPKSSVPGSGGLFGMAPQVRSVNVLILGTGIAALSTALKLARDYEVLLVSKSSAEEGATRYAQGGIASVWSKTDSFEEHKQDTMTAGAGLC